MEDDEFGFVRMNSKLVCVKPRGDMRTLLIGFFEWLVSLKALFKKNLKNKSLLSKIASVW